MFTINIAHRLGHYPLFIGTDLNHALANKLPKLLPQVNRYALITDETAGKLFGAAIQNELSQKNLAIEIFTFPAGEAYKNRETKAQLEDQLLQQGFGRDSAIIALGGGVVTDLAGFLAATYLRGVPFISLPTTLLGAADASIGGKNGVDTPAGKNLIGSFYPPQAVFIDVDTWKTLPLVEIRNGLAETIKQAILGDETFFTFLESTAARFVELLQQERSDQEEQELNQHSLTIAEHNCRVKQSIVQADEQEQGKRQLLNWGHTLGHALESLSDFSIPHGYAVSIGSVLAAEIGKQLGYTDPTAANRQKTLLQQVGLPTELPASFHSKEAIEQLIRRTYTDKKARNGSPRYVFVEKVGQMKQFLGGDWSIPVDDQVVRSVLEEYIDTKETRS